MTNFKNIALIALLLMNIGLVIMLWLQPMPHERSPGGKLPPPPRKAEGFLVKALKLDAEQRGTLKALREEHFESTREIHKDVRAAKRAMFDALLASSPDTATARQMAAEYGDHLQKIDELLIQHYLDIREICTPEQQEELRKVFRKAIRRPRPR